MMGVQATSARLFYDFCLDDHVPSDHILRSIDRHLDLDDVRQALKPFYSSTGRPSIDPELMIRMLIAAIAWAYARSADCARRFISISPIAGFAASVWMTKSRTIRPFPRTGTGAFARAMSFAICSKPSLSAAWPKGWSEPMDSPSTPA